MKVTTVINGDTQLVLHPENELEEDIIKRMHGATLSLVADNMQLIGKSLKNCAILSSSQREYPDSHKTENIV